jgi:replicative DNA helicase
MANPDEIIGHDLGPCFPQLNQALRGLQKGRLHVVAAGQSVGKTAFGDNITAHLAIHMNIPTLVVGLEMGETEYHMRLLGQMTGIDYSLIDSGRINDKQRDQVARAVVKLGQAPLWFECPDSMDSDRLAMLCRSYKLSHGIEAVFLDYVQLMEPTKGQRRQSRYETMGDIVKTMKLPVARGMDLSFICAAQMNRDSTKSNKQATAEGIADSYIIAQTADTFMILQEPEGNAQALDLIIDKNRQGRKDLLIGLHFDGPTQVMREYKGGQKVPPYRVP